MILSLGKVLMHRDSCPYLVSMCLTISYTSVGGIRQLIFQISRIDSTVMGCWISGQVRTMMRILIFKSNWMMV